MVGENVNVHINHNKKSCSNEHYSDYVLKRKRLSKTKTILLFRRNNLSFKLFKSKDGIYVYDEDFEFHGVCGKLKIVVNTENFQDVFCINCKSVKFKGVYSHFGLYLRFPDQKEFPIDKHVVIGCVEISLRCKGNRLFYDAAKRKRIEGGNVSTSSARYAVEIPDTVLWAAKNPFSGGGFSPK